jgi:Sulfotransferase family
MGDLSSAPIIATAQEGTGLSDFGGDEWREALDVLTEALVTEANLTEFGEVVAQADLVGSLTRRLQVVEHRRTHPEVAAESVERPVFIVGQVRTGTTITYELLAQDPAARAPLTWEVDAPCPPPEAGTYDADPRIEDSRQIQEMMLSILPEFKTMHPLGPLLAQECVRITGMDVKSFIFPTMYHVPSYAQWLLEADMTSAYRWHRGFLQHLQSRNPVSRWVVKSPGHIWALDAMMNEYPDALVIQTHRDPLRVIASVSSLACTLRTFASEARPIGPIADEWAEYVIEGIDRSVDARESGLIPAMQVVDVHYGSLAADPIATVAAIYDQLGLDFTAGAEENMRRFLAAQPEHEHGGHHYTFAGTGLDAKALRERTARYQDYFDVPNEPLG